MTTTSWNLDELYSGIEDPKLQEDFDAASTTIDSLASYRDTLANLTVKEFAGFLTTWESLGEQLYAIGLYADLLESTHIGDAEVTRFQKSTEERLIQMGKRLIFIDVEMAHFTTEKWNELLQASELKTYRHFLQRTADQAKHTLSEPEEAILAEKSQTSSSAMAHLFSVVTNTLEIQWGNTIITLDQALTYLRDPDGETRKKAALTIHHSLNTNGKVTPIAYNTLVHDKSIHDRLRHFDYPEQARYDADDVTKQSVETMVSAVRGSDHLVQRYYTIKKQILGLDKLHWWDRYAPLPQPKTKIEMDEAKRIVFGAFHDFSPEFAHIAQTMEEKQHIDWLPSPTKRGGAFCAFGGTKLHPYVLLNYTNDLRDVMTLAHELGHAIHDVYAQKHNPFLLTHPSLALAEIASTFGESLVFDALMAREIDSQEKIALLMSTIEDAFSTIHRQVTMFQFEQKAHTLRKTAGELSREQLNKLWHETIREPFGDTVTFTDEHKNFWMYIPHIINTPFYVYSYAFAQLCTYALIQKAKEDGASFVDTYTNILKAGGSDSPEAILKKAGLDTTEPEFWQTGLKLIDDYISQLQKLM